MSKFVIESGYLDAKSLYEKDFFELFEELYSNLNGSLFLIAKEAVEFMKKNSLNYRLKSVGEKFVIVIKKIEMPDYLCVGYPFPMKRIKADKLFQDYSISYFVRGTTVREKQRDFLFSELQKKYEIVKYDFKSEKLFRNKFMDVIGECNYDAAYYYDYYNFIGDTYLSTYMFDSFIDKCSIKKAYYITKNSTHMLDYYNILSHSDYEMINNDALYIFANLLDVDAGYVYNYMTFSEKDGVYVDLSRNRFMVKSGKLVELYILKKDDLILKTNNIYDYMSKCIRPFVGRRDLNCYESIDGLGDIKVYLNPFGSISQKSLTTNETIRIVKLLFDKGINDIYMPFGHDMETQTKVKKIVDKMDGIKLINSKDIKELFNILKQKDINFLITVDTSITHIATKNKVINCVIYKKGFWDMYSAQSLSAESPIGFCGYSPYQLPVCFNGSSENAVKQINNVLSVVRGNSEFDYYNNQDYVELLKYLDVTEREILKSSAEKIGLSAKKNFYRCVE